MAQPARKPLDKVVNGVDVDGVLDTIKAVEEEPCLAACTFRVYNRWITGGHNRTTVLDYYAAGQDNAHRETFVLGADEPELLQGGDRAPGPTEHLLHALAACLTSSLVYHAALHDIRLDMVEATLEGDLDLRGFLAMPGAARTGYQNVRVTFRIKGDATDAALQELCAIAQQRSPVFDIVAHPVPVAVTVQRA